MALPTAACLSPSEVAFLCEMEPVTIIPRQRLESLQLLGLATPFLKPPHRAILPLWLALLLKRQQRASIAPPPWLHPDSLQKILDQEMSTAHHDSFGPSQPLPPMGSSGDGAALLTPPFQDSCTATASGDTLPYHYLEVAQLLVAHCSDDIQELSQVQRLLRDLREVRLAKLRVLLPKLDGGAGVNLSGIGALELAESRTFMAGVVDGLRKLGTSREATIKERSDEDAREGFSNRDEDDSDMEL